MLNPHSIGLHLCPDLAGKYCVLQAMFIFSNQGLLQSIRT